MTCVRCDDTGWIEFTAGTYMTYGNSLGGPVTVEASERHPVLKRCSCAAARPEKPKPAEVVGREYS